MDSYRFVPDLDVIGSLEGTDKSSFIRWDYLRHYQELFAPWRDQPINLLEIGIGDGPSLRVWRSFFSQATIIGIDNRPECSRFAGDRVIVEIGSQDDPAFLYRICAKYPPTIVIDDGSHMAHHIVYTLEHVFPALAEGGVYVVEDLSLHFGPFGPQHHNTKDVSAVDYFLRLARSRMDFETRHDTWGDENYMRRHVDSMAFFAGGVALRKKPPLDTVAALHGAEQYISQIKPSASHLGRYAHYLLRHGGSLQRAEQAARDAVILSPGDIHPLYALSEVLVRLGRFQEAAAADRMAAEQRPDDGPLWYRLSLAERRLQRIPEAIEALKKAVSIQPEWYYFRDLCEVLEANGELQEALTAGQQGAERGAGQPGVAGLQRRLESLRARLAAAA
jgi:Flp pilus assembly protein TadD